MSYRSYILNGEFELLKLKLKNGDPIGRQMWMERGRTPKMARQWEPETVETNTEVARRCGGKT